MSETPTQLLTVEQSLQSIAVELNRLVNVQLAILVEMRKEAERKETQLAMAEQHREASLTLMEHVAPLAQALTNRNARRASQEPGPPIANHVAPSKTAKLIQAPPEVKPCP
jgi:hypothetical protein